MIPEPPPAAPTRRLDRPYRRAAAIIAADAILCALAGMCAFQLRFEFSVPAQWSGIFWPTILVWVAVKVVVFYTFDLHRASWRYISTHEMQRIVVANVVGSGLATLALFFWFRGRFPRSLPPLELVMAIALTAGTRLAFRLLHESSARGDSGNRHREARALIYGAGSAGIALLREIRQNLALGYVAFGFIDDDPGKLGAHVHGLRVLGSGKDLKRLAAQYSVEQVLVTIPTATGAEMAAIYDRCRQAGVLCRTMPGMAEVVEGRTLANQIRDLSIEDLLGRKAVTLDQQSIMSVLAGQTVMVTGAAGSIGSELCRQIARFQPAAIVAYEVAETPLFFLEREMRARFPNVPLHGEIGSIQNPERLAEVMRQHRPTILYHAAAYKHVPMMEANPYEAVANNMFGTEAVLRAAREEGVRTFVMISTDKAVRPTNVMGTTKRIAELLVNALSSEAMKTVSVRFGNVLGSSGSVLPIFRQQLAQGGPITVTHPEMQRYFMTIPEASQLVLQASAIGEGGQILVLDMGEMVKIVDLAYNLIRLAGLEPGRDIQVEFTGIRPGEKLFEEINLHDESTVPTSHEKIRVFRGPAWGRKAMEEHLRQIRQAWESRNTEDLLRLMKQAVPEYNVNRDLIEREAALLAQAREAGPEVDEGPEGVRITLLGGVGGHIGGRLVPSPEPFLHVAVESPVTVGAAVRVDRNGTILLGEVCACEGEAPVFDVVIRVEHRLIPARPSGSS